MIKNSRLVMAISTLLFVSLFFVFILKSGISEYLQKDFGAGKTNDTQMQEELRPEIEKKSEYKFYPDQKDVIKYKLTKKTTEYCAVCGDGICDYIEKCLPSSPITQDCGGGLYCPKDCEK